ncbi:MAG TPA: alpha/beta fold hydrolase [Steroidobacteraceae bacterium]|nr:alpha/beta fold hydrolase [Steroidobacteraceae bacterium]
MSSDGPRPFRPPAPEKAVIAGPVGPLEAVYEVPEGYSGRDAAVVCHPHPLYGGTMQNKVVHSTARALQERGFATVRFNFRGVGASAGTFDDGRGETDDALAVYDALAARFPGARLTLAGFSFGAFVAYRVAELREVARLYTIAPPVGRFDFARYPAPRAPWIVIQGDRDELVDHAQVLAWTGSVSPPPTVVIIAGAEHFFHGRLNELKAAVQAALAAGRG